MSLTILTTTTAWCQVTVNGTVLAKEDTSALPGVYIVEKGTRVEFLSVTIMENVPSALVVVLFSVTCSPMEVRI